MNGLHKTKALYLGSSIDADLNGQASADASGDDADADGDDEDGVSPGLQWQNGTDGGSVTVTVVGSGWLVAWVDFRYSDAGDIFAQKLDGNGNKLWANAGVPLCTAGEIQISLNILF